jgi:hypothetical protein
MVSLYSEAYMLYFSSFFGIGSLFTLMMSMTAEIFAIWMS